MKSFKLFSVLALSALVMSFTIPAGVLPFEGTAICNFEGSKIVWKSEEIDLGKIPQGKPVAVEFSFTNKGEEAVIISNVATTCGCTVADYSKKPIGANEVSKISATYNAASLGAFTKGITVTFADNTTKVLNIKGVVI